MTTNVAHPPNVGFSELARKGLHIAMGGFALTLAFLPWWQALILAIAALLHNLFLLPLYGRRRLFRDGDPSRTRDTGILLYPLSIAILIVVFHQQLEIVAAAWGLLAFGDGFATVAGTLVRGPRLPWNRAKSWPGYLAFIIFGFLAARFLYVFTVVGQTHRQLRGVPQLAADAFLAERLHVGMPLSAAFGWGFAIVAMIGATTILAATLESLPIGLDDNISVPLASAGFLFCLTLFDAGSWTEARPAVVANLPWAIGINVALAGLAYAARSVSLSGVVGGVLVGSALYTFGGPRAFLMLLIFFVLGTAATKTGHARKAALGIAQEKGGRRGAKNAVANCGVAAICAFVAATSPYGPLAMLALVAAFATAACDTVSSEIGQALGRTTYLVTNFQRVRPGTDGAVSLEGTLAGIAAAAMLALAALGLGLVTAAGAILVIAAAFFGSTLESYMGAVWERSKLIDNEAINFANTLAGALFAIAVPALLPAIPFVV